LSGSFLHALAALPMAAHSCLPFANDGRVLRMILTCPSCGTQYVVKDGAIPPSGRQVRCKACQHSWREFPPADEQQVQESVAEAEPTDTVEAHPAAEAVAEQPEEFNAPGATADDYADALPEEVEPVSAYDQDEPLAEEPSPSPIPPEADVVGLAEAAPSHRLEWVEEDDDFSPFAPREPEKVRSRSGIILAAVVVLVIAAIVAGLWFLAPAEWRQRLGIAEAGETPLQLMMTHSDRTQLASGNEFLNISGRIINPTDEQQQVPPIHAQLHDGSGKVVYKWTIPPPTKTIPPGGSASFNSAELNIPPAAQELTVTLGEPKA
jgi:predicted Zn finger-like uncharacterized protein